jgi:hypothetical protein
MPQLIDFCPASAAADTVARLEGYLAIVLALQAEAEALCPEAPAGLADDLAARTDQLVFDLEAARDRLAEADAVSAAGAIAQLLAAMRDIRVDDDAERLRARKLEAAAIGFLERSHLLSREAAVRLCGSQAGRSYPASRAISASETS